MTKKVAKNALERHILDEIPLKEFSPSALVSMLMDTQRLLKSIVNEVAWRLVMKN
jgi:hypothetical protein